MEHVLHIFGGGCGEHMVWPWLVSGGSALTIWFRSKILSSSDQE